MDIELPLINNGKRPEDPLAVGLILALPHHSSYGNLTLKSLKIIERLDHANLRIIQLPDLFIKRVERIQLEVPRITNDAPPVYFHIEEIIYSIRKAVDELVTLLYLKGYYSNAKTYPLKLEVDSIGSFLHSNKEYLVTQLTEHRAFLKLLNEISNAHKHSFINTDHNIESTSEPVVFALALDNNNLSIPAVFHSVLLKEVITEFNEFYIAITDELRIWNP